MDFGENEFMGTKGDLNRERLDLDRRELAAVDSGDYSRKLGKLLIETIKGLTTKSWSVDAVGMARFDQ